MKIDFTNSELRASAFGILFALFVGVVLLSLSGCSSGSEQNATTNQINFSGEKSFSFKDEGSNWRVDFEDDEISALYKDGSRIPDSEIEQHKEMIYENLRQLHSEYDDLAGNVHRFHFDMDKFKEDMGKFKHDFDNDKFMHFKLEFDEDEFEKNMEKLEENLKVLKDKKIELYFDSEDFKDNMKELEENLKDLPAPPIPPDVDIDVYLDMDDFKDGMKKFGESFKHFDLKIDSSDFDMSELRESMRELKKNMKGLKIEMHDLKGEMKKLNAFLDDLKSELVKDRYIKSTEEEINLEMDKDHTKINDVDVKAEDHTKYKELYKRHFDKEIDKTIRINKD
jgi:chromosome segregation ATPase